MQLFYARTTASQNQDFFTLIHFKRWFFFSEQKENQTGMWWINDQLSPCWSNVSRPKLWLYGKWLLHFSSKCLCSPAGSSAELPEGVSEVHTPSLQLLWVVGRHVGELSEDVEVRGVSWWRKKKTQNVNDGKWFEWDLIRHGEEKEKKKKSLTWFFWTVKTSFIWNLWAEELWVRKRPRWKERRHREASLFQLSGFWAFTFLVAMVTAESTDTTKAVEVFCVPWELPGPAN